MNTQSQTHTLTDPEISSYLKKSLNFGASVEPKVGRCALLQCYMLQSHMSQSSGFRLLETQSF